MRFTDERLYVLGIGTGYMTDLKTGDFLYWSDKMQEANVSVSASDNELRAGLGNGPAIIVPTDPNITVTVTAAEYSEYVKAASVGAAITQSAPVMVCREVTAEGPNLTVDLSGGTPVEGLGMDKAVCYVQEVGEESRVYSGGKACELDSTTGTIEGFTAESGKQYAVSYFVTQANATLTTVTTNVKGRVVRFVFSQPVYSNYDPAANSGEFWGWLHTVVPRLQLMPSGGGTDGSQTSFTVTGITGRAVAQDAAVITEECGECGFTGLPMMYRILEPCGNNECTDGIIGLIGGEINLNVGETRQMTPAVIGCGTLNYSVPADEFSYESKDVSIAAVGEKSGSVAGLRKGETNISVSLLTETGELTDKVLVRVLNDGAAPSVVYLKVESDSLTQTLYFTQSAAGAVSVNWGDGSQAVITGDLNAAVSHTYSVHGYYTVTMTAETGTTYSPGALIGNTQYSLSGAANAYGSYFVHANVIGFAFGDGCGLQDYSFAQCRQLQSIVIPNGITAIPLRAFYYCQSLYKAELPDEITQIGEYAFYNCKALSSISLSSELENIGRYAFSGSGLTSVDLPVSITEIGANAFSNTNLQIITVPASVSSNLDSAFAYCDLLEEAIIECSFVGVSMFRDCRSLKQVTFGGGVNTIRSGAFSRCYSLVEVIIPPSVTLIQSQAFENCRSLTSIKIPATVNPTQPNDAYIFSGCIGLKYAEVACPSAGLEMFRRCTGLEKVWIRNSVTTIRGITAGNSMINLANPNVIMYVEAASRPSGWNPYWNYVNGEAVTTVWNQSEPPF